jgi:hypothetical protein
MPVFWQWTTATKAGDTWPALGVWDGGEKLLVSKDARQIELFRFPADSFEKTNLSPEHSADVSRLRALLAGWTAMLPARAASACFSTGRKK